MSSNSLKNENDFVELIHARLAKPFDTKTQVTRPFVTLSYAQSLDGSISLHKNVKTKISNYQAQVFNHRLRSLHDAILIGINTLVYDDPRLTVRYVSGKNPVPVIVDSKLRFPLKSSLLKDNSVSPLVATTNHVQSVRIDKLNERGIRVLQLPSLKNGWVNLGELMKLLHKRKINSVMVEGGSRILSSFLGEGLVDQIVLNISPMILGGFRGVTHSNGRNTHHLNILENVHFHNLSGDLFIRGDIVGEAG